MFWHWENLDDTESMAMEMWESAFVCFLGSIAHGMDVFHIGMDFSLIHE